MVPRSVLAWCALLVLAIANGAAREAWLNPRFGDRAGHVVSTVTLSVLILLLGWCAVPWINPRTLRDAWSIGIIWLLLTLAFEFLAGHFMFGRSWELLLADYDIAAGRIWPVVLIVTLITPVLAFTTRVS